MQNHFSSLDALENTLGAYLIIEDYDIDDLAGWCRKYWPAAPRAREFKEQLRAAIQQPGLVSPQTYRSWTADPRFPTQEQLQEHLKEVWMACFPGEAVE